MSWAKHGHVFGPCAYLFKNALQIAHSKPSKFKIILSELKCVSAEVEPCYEARGVGSNSNGFGVFA